LAWVIAWAQNLRPPLAAFFLEPAPRFKGLLVVFDRLLEQVGSGRFLLLAHK
jgi:hypothetical protein